LSIHNDSPHDRRFKQQTVPLTVQFRTLGTADSSYNVQTDGVPRCLSAIYS